VPNYLSQAHNMLSIPTVMDGRPLSKYEARKFILRNSAQALIQPKETDRLIDYTRDESVMFRQVTIQRMDTNEEEIRFLELTGGVLRLATCNAPETESVDIQNNNKCLKTISLDAKFYLCDDDIQDGLTGAQLEDQIMTMTGTAMANEGEILAWMGNTNGVYSNPAVIDSSVLHARDMWYRQLQQGHLLNANSFAPEDRTISTHKLSCMIRAIPTKYRGTPEAQRFYMPADMEEDWAELIQARETPNLGDANIVGPTTLRYHRRPIVPVPLIPTNIATCGCDSLPPTADGTFVVLTDPKNLVVGIEKNITFERWRYGPRHLTWFIWTFRMDAIVFNEDETSLLDCAALNDCGDTCVADPLPAGRCFSCIDDGS
jgi:hypothetical protein